MAVSVESLKRNYIPVLSGVIIGAGLTLLESRYPQRKFNTHPNIPNVFKAADKILEFAAMRFLEVYSHHWHWENIPGNEEFNPYGVYLKGAPSGNPHNNPFFGVIAHLGGRPYGYIVEADSPQNYFVGFGHKRGETIRRCKIELNEPVMLLAGPDEGCIAYAMDKNNRPLKLKLLSDLIHRKDKPAGVRIL